MWTIADVPRCTPLHLAVNSGCISVVKLLIEKGADVTATTKNGCTPLHPAASCGRIEAPKHDSRGEATDIPALRSIHFSFLFMEENCIP